MLHAHGVLFLVLLAILMIPGMPAHAEEGCVPPSIVSGQGEAADQQELSQIWKLVSGRDESAPETRIFAFPEESRCYRGYARDGVAWINLLAHPVGLDRETIFHEYVHLWAAQIWNTSDPWIEEGLAGALSYRYCGRECRDSEAKLMRVFESRGDKLLLDSVTTVEESSSALGFMYWMVETFGGDRFIEGLTKQDALDAKSVIQAIPYEIRATHSFLEKIELPFLVGHYRLSFALFGKTVFRPSHRWENLYHRFGKSTPTLTQQEGTSSKLPSFWSHDCNTDSAAQASYEVLPTESPITRNKDACLWIRISIP